MASRRSGAAVAALAGQLYVCGGYDGGSMLHSAERFLPGTGLWETLPPMSVSRDHAAVAAISSSSDSQRLSKNKQQQSTTL